MLLLFSDLGERKGVIVPMLFAAVGAAGSVLLTTDDESHKGYGTNARLNKRNYIPQFYAVIVFIL